MHPWVRGIDAWSEKHPAMTDLLTVTAVLPVLKGALRVTSWLWRSLRLREPYSHEAVTLSLLFGATRRQARYNFFGLGR